MYVCVCVCVWVCRCVCVVTCMYVCMCESESAVFPQIHVHVEQVYYTKSSHYGYVH